MKFLKYTLNLILVAMLLLATSCKDSFLDVKPIAKPSTETYYLNLSSIESTVTAAYGELCSRQVFDIDYFFVVGSVPSDDAECGGENINDYSIAQHYDQFVHDMSDATPLEEIWRYCYKGLRFANTALENIPKVAELDTTASKATLAQRTAEMKFLRGLYHLMLVQVFGGVPIADHMIQTNELSNPRNSIKEVLDFIQQDLKEAIPDLPVKSDLGAEIGRASKGAAQALLAKAIIYESSYAKNYPGDERFAGCVEHWQDALTYAKAVIGSGEYALIGLNGERFASWRTGNDVAATIDGFRYLFTADADNSSEGIFEIQSVNDGLGWGSTRGNALTTFETVRWYTNSGGNQTAYGGWSFNCPTESLVKAFANNDTRETNLHSVTGVETDDPRFVTTIGREGDSILTPTADKTKVLMDLSNTPTGMIGRKFECGFDEFWTDGQWTQGPFNVRLIRYADLLLLAAEAAFESGDQSLALEYVNMVRTRARNSGTTGKPENLTAISFEDIMHERRLELALEPHRFFDLVRWGQAKKFLDVPVEGQPGFTINFQEGKHEFWPIPQSEIDYSKGGLVQYPAWQ